MSPTGAFLKMLTAKLLTISFTYLPESNSIA